MVGRLIVRIMLLRTGENPLWSFFDQSSQLFSTVSRTLLVYSLRLSLYKFEASTFAGDPVFGSLSKLVQSGQLPCSVVRNRLLVAQAPLSGSPAS